MPTPACPNHHDSNLPYQKLRKPRNQDGKDQRHGDHIGIEFEFIENHETGPRHAIGPLFVGQFLVLHDIQLGRGHGKGHGHVSHGALQSKDGREGDFLVQLLTTELRRRQEGG